MIVNVTACHKHKLSQVEAGDIVKNVPLLPIAVIMDVQFLEGLCAFQEDAPKRGNNRCSLVSPSFHFMSHRASVNLLYNGT